MTPQDNELATAFAELRHSATAHFTAPDTDEIHRAATARRARTRNFSVAAALLAATVIVTTSIAAQSPPPATDREPLSTAHALQPPPPTPGPPQPTGTARPDLANLVRFLDDEQINRLREATITLPAWPAGGQACPAGTYTFRDGKAPTGARDQTGRPFDYLLLFRASLGIHANLDAVPGDELVVPIACGFTEVTYQLLVLKADGRALGYLPALPAFDRFYPYGEGLVVEVQNHPFDTIAEQRRRYGWNGTRFVQTHGPAAWPADLAPDLRHTDLRQSYLTVGQCGGGLLSFLDGVSGTWPFADRDNGGDTRPAAHFELGEISTGLLAEPAEFAAEGDALVTVSCRPAGQPRQTWVVKASAAKAIPVLKVGDGGTTAVISHRITGGLAEITVQNRDGRQVWRFSSDGHTMTRTG